MEHKLTDFLFKFASQKQMLKTIGADSLDQLIFETIPSDIRLKNGLNLLGISAPNKM